MTDESLRRLYDQIRAGACADTVLFDHVHRAEERDNSEGEKGNSE